MFNHTYEHDCVLLRRADKLRWILVFLDVSATPPLGALRMVISIATTPKQREAYPVLTFIGITRVPSAMSHATTPSLAFLTEDPLSQEPSTYGLLQRSLYGLRDASQNI